MSQPNLKILEHPNFALPNNVWAIDFGWGKVTIEYPHDDRINAATALYCLEMAKLEVMGIK